MRFRVAAFAGLVTVVVVAFSILDDGDDGKGAVVERPAVEEKAELVAEADVELEADAEADTVAVDADTDADAPKEPAKRVDAKRRARAKNAQPQPARPGAKGISSDDALEDLGPPP